MELETSVTSTGTTIEESSGNIFADLGLPHPEESLLKSQLALQIDDLIKSRKLTQTAAGELAGLSQPKISDILRGRLEGYSVERLLLVINRLGCDVELRISRRADSRDTTRGETPAQGHTSVVAA